MRTPSRQSLAALSLVLIATVVPSLTGGTTQADVLLRPVPLFFAVVIHGLPVLAIREWAVRRQVAAGGLFVVGIGYALLVEGLVTKSLFRVDGLPNASFDGQPTVLGVNASWAVLVVTWQALGGVVAPIAVTHALFPQLCWRRWTGRLAPTLSVLPLLGFAVATGLAPHGGRQAGWAEVALFVALAAALTGAGLAIKGTWAGPPLAPATAAAAGAAATLLVPVLSLVAESRPGLVLLVPVILGSLAALAVVGVRYRLDRLPALAFAALGCYAVAAVFAVISLGDGAGATALALVVVLAILAGGLMRSNRLLASTSPPGTVAEWHAGPRSASWLRPFSWLGARRP